MGARVFRAAHRLARALRRSGLPCEGVNMFLADGEVAFQEVFHVHLHVLPRERRKAQDPESRRRARPGPGPGRRPPRPLRPAASPSAPLK